MGSGNRDRAASTEAILKAGIRVFGEKGYDAATTKEITSSAGLNEQLLTRYFGGKAGLLMAIYKQFIENKDDDREYMQSPLREDAYSEIEHFLLKKHAHMRQTSDLLKVVISRLLVDHEARSHFNTTVVNQTRRVLTARLRLLQDKGMIRIGVDIEFLSQVIAAHSFTQSFLAVEIMGVAEDVSLSALKAFARLLVDGITGLHCTNPSVSQCSHAGKPMG
jgi:AcrR family transcriptional regulator